MKCLRSKPAVFVYTVLIFFFVTFEFLDGRIVLFAPKTSTTVLTISAVPYTFTAVGVFFLAAWFIRRVRGGRGVLFYLLAGMISLVYSFFSFLGKYYSTHPGTDLSTILAGERSLIKALACLLGGGVLFFLFLLGLDMVREAGAGDRKENTGRIRQIQEKIFGKRCFAWQCLIMGVCWLPHILLRYPGALPQDAKVALSQYYGVKAYTTQHPIIYTLLVGKLTDFGSMLGNPNYGLYILVWLQVIALILAFSYLICTMRRFRMPYWCCTFALVMCAVTPNIIAFATTILIDALYLAAFAVLMVELVWYLYRPEQYKRSWRHLLLTAVAVAGTFFRYNGIYIVAVVLVLILFREGFLLLKKRQKPGYSLIIILVFLLPLCAGKAGVSYLNQSYHTQSVGGRAMFALPMQQIARYMVYHSEDLTKAERKKLKKVMRIPVKDYKERYRPYNFDGVKSGFNPDATKKELLDFLGVWMKMLSRHPGTCILATLQQNYLLFSPLHTTGCFHDNERKFTETGTVSADNLLVENTGSERWIILRNNLNQYYRNFLQSPVGGLLMSIGWYTLLLMGICLYALCEKNWNLLFLGVPLLLVLAIIFVGPAIYGHQRYVLPIWYTMPLLVGVFAGGSRMTPESGMEDEEN